MVVLRRPPFATGDFGGTKLSLLLEKQHNRGQDGAGAAILRARPVPGEVPYWIAKSASSTPLVDVLGAIAKRSNSFSHKERKEHKEEEEELCYLCGEKQERIFLGHLRYATFGKNLCGEKQERIFLGHLRYATFGKNEVAFCHPFVHEASELEHTLLLAGNFNLTNAHELFEDYSQHGSFPTSKSDGYLVCELIAHELEHILPPRGGSLLSLRGERETRSFGEEITPNLQASKTPSSGSNLSAALSRALANADGAWTLCGATGDGWAFATRDPHGIRPGFYYISDDVVSVASERPAIQAAFDVPPEAVKELPPGQALIISPSGEVRLVDLDIRHSTTNNRSRAATVERASATPSTSRPCSFERIYFSRANDAAIHRERKALGAALLPQILKSAEADLSDIFFSYIPNSARIAFHGLLEELIRDAFHHIGDGTSDFGHQTSVTEVRSPKSEVFKSFPRFGEVIVKDAKFRTFIADAAARREFYKHVYDVTYGLVRPGLDTLVVLDDSIVRGNTMKNAILPMLDRLEPKRIVIASSAPPIRYPDCYGIDMSTLGELVAFRALVNLIGGREKLLSLLGDSEFGSLGEDSNASPELQVSKTSRSESNRPSNPLAPLYARFTDEQHCAEIARLLTPPGMKAEVKVVYQTVENLRECLTTDFGHQTSKTWSLASTTNNESRTTNREIGDWYFTGDYPTPGGYKVLHKALENYFEQKSERSY